MQGLKHKVRDEIISDDDDVLCENMSKRWALFINV